MILVVCCELTTLESSRKSNNDLILRKHFPSQAERKTKTKIKHLCEFCEFSRPSGERATCDCEFLMQRNFSIRILYKNSDIHDQLRSKSECDVDLLNNGHVVKHLMPPGVKNLRLDSFLGRVLRTPSWHFARWLKWKR